MHHPQSLTFPLCCLITAASALTIPKWGPGTRHLRPGCLPSAEIGSTCRRRGRSGGKYDVFGRGRQGHRTGGSPPTTTTSWLQEKPVAQTQQDGRPTPASADVEGTDESFTSPLVEKVLNAVRSTRDEAIQYAEAFGLSAADAGFYALFRAIRDAPVALGLKGEPFLIRHGEMCGAMMGGDGEGEGDSAATTHWPGFFGMDDLERAVDEDFLDAARGSTDNRKGWQVTDVSQPRGDSFEEARMTFGDVQAALDRGTVIFNAAGAHIPKLAGPSLACTDATTLPCALNLYVTAKGKRTSAPPHTDKQDVVVIQTSGRKHWRVYSPPKDPSRKPGADIFARGKHDDSMPLHLMTTDIGCDLLIEATLNPGDALFVPAGFPHTTDTVHDDDENPHSQETSIHLTLGIDHHIWELDYLSARRLALRRAHVKDTALGQMNDDENPYIGKVNELPVPVWNDLLAELPLGLLEEDDATAAPYIDEVTTELERISRAVDSDTASAVEPSLWRETALRFRQEGLELLEIHRDMYLAAIEEGQKRETEEAMTAHLGKTARRAMSPERIQRLSLFRVKPFFDKINESKAGLKQWSYEGTLPPKGQGSGTTALPENWAYTLPVNVGDQVEADLGGAFFPATVTRAADETYDVQFFDGDREMGLDRSMIRLVSPPKVAAAGEEVDTSSMTPKQLKRWTKQQEKLQKKNKK